MLAIFQPRIANKINKAPSVRVLVICNDHRLLCRDSYKCVDHTLTPDGSRLHKIIIIRCSLFTIEDTAEGCVSLSIITDNFYLMIDITLPFCRHSKRVWLFLTPWLWKILYFKVISKVKICISFKFFASFIVRKGVIASLSLLKCVNIGFIKG